MKAVITEQELVIKKVMKFIFNLLKANSLAFRLESEMSGGIGRRTRGTLNYIRTRACRLDDDLAKNRGYCGFEKVSGLCRVV